MTVKGLTIRAAGRCAAAGLLASLLSSCGQPDRLSVDKAWIRLPAVTSRPAAAYFTITGGPRDATLINVSGDLAIRAEMHESMASGGMMQMKPLASVTIPAHATVAFQPGGRHVMLYEIAYDMKRRGSMMLTFSFADGSRLRRKAIVVGAGDPEPEW